MEAAGQQKRAESHCNTSKLLSPLLARQCTPGNEYPLLTITRSSCATSMTGAAEVMGYTTVSIWQYGQAD